MWKGSPNLKSLPVAIPLDPADFKDRTASCPVVDTRMPGAFVDAHVPGAISIWTSGLPSFAGWFLPYDRLLLLVTEDGQEEIAIRHLIRIGYDRIEGRLSGGMHEWHMAGQVSARSGTTTVQEMCRILDSEKETFFLDVRSKDESEKDGESQKRIIFTSLSYLNT